VSDYCTVCKPPASVPDLPPGAVAIDAPGTIHRTDCPRLPRPTPEQEADLHRQLDELARARRRAWIESRDMFIGGTSC
jgi:hypothetical protein